MIKTKIWAKLQKQVKANKLLKSLFNEFVYGGHLLSLGASGIVLSCAIIADSKIDIGMVLIPYLLSQSIYGLNHFLELKEDLSSNPERAGHLARNNAIVLIITYLFLLVVSLFVYSNLPASLVILSILVFGLIYPKKITSKVLGFKNIYVSLFWALTVLFLQYYVDDHFRPLYIVLFIFVFLKFLLSTVFFDLKDVESDRKARLRTIPVSLGVNNTTIFLNFVNVFIVALLVWSVYYGIIPKFALLLIVLSLYDLYYVIYGSKLNKKQLRFLSYVVVDGEYMLWPLILIVSKLIGE